MSYPNPVPPQIPAMMPAIPNQLPLGEHPEEREGISSPFVAIEAILRQPRRVIYQLRQSGAGRLIAGMVFVSLVCSLVYGIVVGSFSMGSQLWAAPVKVAGGLMISALICLPSLYIFTCLSGSRARLIEICGLISGLLMLMTILLVGFAPVAWLFSQCTESSVWIGALHLSFWSIATCFGLRFLISGFSHSQARATAGLNTWIVIFILVSVQMTTALRHILGKGESFLANDRKLFLNHWADCIRSGQASPDNAALNRK